MGEASAKAMAISPQEKASTFHYRYRKCGKCGCNILKKQVVFIMAIGNVENVDARLKYDKNTEEEV